MPVVGDALDEDDETFVVNLSGATVATIADNQGDQARSSTTTPSPSLVDRKRDGHRGEQRHVVDATFTVTLSSASGRVVTVAYATANGTATAPADYAGHVRDR